MKKSLSKFLWTACVTPFSSNGDSINYCNLKRLLLMQNKAGNGLLLLGSTGEVLSLTDSEKRKLVEFVCGLELDVPIMIGVPGVNLYQTLEWLDFCKNMPIHGYLMTTPIYTKPGIIGQTLWFEKLLEKAHVPAMLYNIPSRAGVNLHVETVYNLSSYEKFWAIKDSSSAIDSIIEYKKIAPNIEIFCGDDNMIFEMAACGATGLVSVVSNIYPRIAHKYVKQCLLLSQSMVIKSRKKITAKIAKNDINSLTNIWQQICKALYIASNPIPVKVLLYNIGLIEHKTVRLPLSTQDFCFSLKNINKAGECLNEKRMV
ncbi:MAG: 4-hydroxy-tetrahydrodipicolinate synthase [Wolbachia endosymbiont of Meromenopon meropis]|nr:4-hydroxy-tetrahydrodipicolinate synthase [Wolbachia endosymbiont of Meromenopon meropis]